MDFENTILTRRVLCLFILTFAVTSISLFINQASHAQVSNLACRLIQITDGSEDSQDPFVCGNGAGVLFESNADLLNNGHANQTDLFFADLSNPSNPVFYQLTNSPSTDDFISSSISDDCTKIAIGTTQNLTNNANDKPQLFYGDISDLNNPVYTQLTNNTDDGEFFPSQISGDGTKIGFSSSLDIEMMNPTMSFNYFIFDINNDVSPFGSVTNNTDGGSFSNTPHLSSDGSRYVTTASANFVPPNQNPLDVRQFYLAELTYNPPALPTSTLFQITNNTTDSPNTSDLSDQGISGNGQVVSFTSAYNLTGMN